MKTYLFALPILLSIPLIAPQIIKAEEKVDLYSLCSKFPHNSRCKNYQPPISLDTRLGEEAKCLVDNQERVEDCKIDIDEKSLIFYIETGESLVVLDYEKDTEELAVPLSDIRSFAYSEKKRVDVGKVLAFGVWGLLSEKKTATFRLNLEPQAITEENNLKQIVFVTNRDTGREMREAIEQETNLVAEVILDID